MKSFLKIGLLFALIVAGRYMQLTTPASAAGLAKSPVSTFASDTTTVMLAHYLDEKPTVATPIGQRQAAERSTTWF